MRGRSSSVRRYGRMMRRQSTGTSQWKVEWQPSFNRPWQWMTWADIGISYRGYQDVELETQEEAAEVARRFRFMPEHDGCRTRLVPPRFEPWWGGRCASCGSSFNVGNVEIAGGWLDLCFACRGDPE